MRGRFPILHRRPAHPCGLGKLALGQPDGPAAGGQFHPLKSSASPHGQGLPSRQASATSRLRGRQHSPQNTTPRGPWRSNSVMASQRSRITHSPDQSSRTMLPGALGAGAGRAAGS